MTAYYCVNTQLLIVMQKMIITAILLHTLLHHTFPAPVHGGLFIAIL